MVKYGSVNLGLTFFQIKLWYTVKKTPKVRLKNRQTQLFVVIYLCWVVLTQVINVFLGNPF